ncbi:4Fe-4S cluster-binding domain-containing protein [Clostridium botulinum]|nr:4Fe-4S cluster-binding domain-containing protein [Clostridium botulinum]EKS4395741.1 4Fe-4S cluster-binding domain-containing protein [Clostridium botulinum]
MNILATQYTLSLKSLDIYVAGCRGDNGVHCTSCHNPETWKFNQGDKYNKFVLNKIKNKINDFDNIINNIMIFGGEPLDQNHNDLLHMLSDLKQFNKDVWLFTRYTINKVPKEVKNLCDYIKCGSYEPELKTNSNIQYGINLATSNQNIYKKGVDY